MLHPSLITFLLLLRKDNVFQCVTQMCHRWKWSNVPAEVLITRHSVSVREGRAADIQEQNGGGRTWKHSSQSEDIFGKLFFLKLLKDPSIFGTEDYHSFGTSFAKNPWLKSLSHKFNKNKWKKLRYCSICYRLLSLAMELWAKRHWWYNIKYKI